MRVVWRWRCEGSVVGLRVVWRWRCEGSVEVVM